MVIPAAAHATKEIPVKIERSELRNALLLAMVTPSAPVGPNLASYDGPFGLPVVLMGLPGIGKTSMLCQLADQLGLCSYVFKTESLQVHDLDGIVVPHEQGVRRVTDNYQVEEIRSFGEGVLIVDEINTGSAKLDAAIRRLVLDREFARAKLPPRVRVMATCNPPDVSMHGRALTPPLANSLAHFEIDPTPPQDWIDFCTAPSQASATVPGGDAYGRLLSQNWGAAYDRALQEYTYVTKTIDAGVLHNMPDDVEKRSGAWPSDRTNTMALNALAACYATDNLAMRLPLMAACIGEAASVQFLEAISSLVLPSLDDVLAGKWAFDSTRPDIVYTVITGVCSRVGRFGPPTAQTIDQAHKLWQLAAALTKDSASVQDLALPLAKALMQKEYGSVLETKTKNPKTAAISQLAADVLMRFPKVVF